MKLLLRISALNMVLKGTSPCGPPYSRSTQPEYLRDLVKKNKVCQAERK